MHNIWPLFLAAMSSSRSDVVTQSVCPFVSSFIRSSVPFFSFSDPGVLSSPIEFQLCFKDKDRGEGGE